MTNQSTYYAQPLHQPNAALECLQAHEVEGNMTPTCYRNFMLATMPMVTDTLLGRTVFVHAPNEKKARQVIASVNASYKPEGK